MTCRHLKKKLILFKSVKLTRLTQDMQETFEVLSSESDSSESEDSDFEMNEELGVSIGLSKGQSRRIDWVF